MKTYGIRIFSVILACLTVLCLFASCSAKNDAAGDVMAPTMGEIKNESAGFTEGGAANLPVEVTERKIIKTYSLLAETKEFDQALTSLESLVTSNGGYIESSSVRNKGLENNNTYTRRAIYTLRIPADKADAFVTSAGTVLHLTSNTSKVEDVSQNYYSIEAVLEELYAERDSLLQMMQSLDNKSDYNFWLTIQQRLSEVKQKIASYQAQLNNYDSKVAYSTVTLEIQEVLSYSAQAENNSFGSRVSAAFSESWSDFGMGCQDFAIWLIEAFPSLLVIAVLVTGAILVICRIRKKRRVRKNTARDENEPIEK